MLYRGAKILGTMMRVRMEGPQTTPPGPVPNSSCALPPLSMNDASRLSQGSRPYGKSSLPSGVKPERVEVVVAVIVMVLA